MTKEQLRAWRDRNFTHHGNRQAAEALGISVNALQKRLCGAVRISRQDELLAQAADDKRALARSAEGACPC